MEKIDWIGEYLEEALRLADTEGHERALMLLDKLLYEEPGYGRLHFTLGKIYFTYTDQVANAEMHLKLAIKFDRELADPYLYLGCLLIDEERYNEAIDVYIRGLNAKRAFKAGLHSGAARSYELMKKYKKAIAHYQDALSYSAETNQCYVLEASIERCRT